jgi:hypothetical protein
MITTNIKTDFDKYVEGLDGYRKRGMYFGVKNTMNFIMEEGASKYKAKIQNAFILRNRWTLGSVRYLRARGRKVQDLEAQYGSYMHYMYLQEFGLPSSGQAGNKSIATYFSAYGKRGAGERRKLPTAKYRQSSIKFTPLEGSDTRSRVRDAIMKAKTAKTFFTGGFPTPAKRGAYSVSLARRESYSIKSHRKMMLDFNMIHDTSKKEVKISRRPLMQFTNLILENMIPRAFENFMLVEVQRNFKRLQRA